MIKKTKEGDSFVNSSMCFEGGMTIYEGNGNGDGWSEFGCPSEKIGGYLCDLTTRLFSFKSSSAFALAS